MKVEIKPLPLKQWHGKEGKESFTLPKTREVLYNASTGRWETGLTEEEAREYGQKLGVDLSDKGRIDEPHPYWSTKTAWLVLPNHTIILDTEKPQDFVKWKNIKASKYVANSMQEWENGEWPDATHVIFDEEGDIEEKASKAQKKQKASALAADMPLAQKLALIMIINERNLRGRSQSFVDVEIDDIIQNKPVDFIKWAEMPKEEVQVRSQVLEAINRNVLTKEGSAIYYLGERIAFDIEDAVKWFKDQDNTKLKVSILEKLNA